ncbi:hypothetical protein ACJW31_01G052300 [Castanea mollissima]
MAFSFTTTSLSLRSPPRPPSKILTLTFCSNSHSIPLESSKRGLLKPGLYLVGTPIGNLEDITLRALRVLNSADVILSEDTRHSGKLLHHYNIKTPLLSYHKFNESQREQAVLKRLKQGEIVALISDAGTPCISDPGVELAKLCVDENILVVPIPGPSALVAALSASGLATDEFTFVGFLPKHAGSRRERLMVSANEMMTQIFYVPPHKLHQFLEETSLHFGDSRQCVIAREMTKMHEEFWRGTLADAKEVFSTYQPKGEITLLIEGKEKSMVETPSECELENQLRDLISSGHSLSTVMASTQRVYQILVFPIHLYMLQRLSSWWLAEHQSVGKQYIHLHCRNSGSNSKQRMIQINANHTVSDTTCLLLD